MQDKLKTAISFHQQKNYKKAKDLYFEILAKNPEHGDCLNCVGLMYAQKDDLEKSIKYLKKAVSLYPQNNLFHNNLANAYKKSNQLELAITHYKNAIALNSNYAEAHNNLAGIYQINNEYELALKHYNHALNLQPDYINAHLNLAYLFIDHNQYNHAIKQFNNVLELNPQSFNACYQLGNLYLENNDFNLAEKHLKQAFKLDSENIDLINNLGALYLQKEQGQLAIEYFTRALSLDNNHLQAKSNLAATFMHYDRFENAIIHYLELITKDPLNIEYLYNLGVANMSLGKLDEAIKFFDKIINQTQHVASITNLASIYLRLENQEKAKDLFKLALEIEPDNTSNQYMLSSLNNEDKFKHTPHEYIKNLFNNYALFYDTHMTKTLNYNVVYEAKKLLTASNFNGTNLISLDLGCGTGLSAEICQDFSNTIIGVDLSQKMLKIADKKNVYTKLVCQDIIGFLNNVDNSFDCICAIEVLSYIGDLDKLFALIKKRLSLNGIFIFSIEITKTKDFILQKSSRFAHNPEYIKELVTQNEFIIKQDKVIEARRHEDNILKEQLFIITKDH